MAYDSVRGGAQCLRLASSNRSKMFETKTYHEDREAHEDLQEYLTTEADAKETRKR